MTFKTSFDCSSSDATGFTLDLEIDYDYTPGSPETGRFGRPEHYDPGEDPRAEITAVRAKLIPICPRCAGTRVYAGSPCPRCRNKGTLEPIDLPIPQAVREALGQDTTLEAAMIEESADLQIGAADDAAEARYREARDDRFTQEG